MTQRERLQALVRRWAREGVPMGGVDQIERCLDGALETPCPGCSNYLCSCRPETRRLMQTEPPPAVVCNPVPGFGSLAGLPMRPSVEVSSPTRRATCDRCGHGFYSHVDGGGEGRCRSLVLGDGNLDGPRCDCSGFVSDKGVRHG